ncbi:MAG: hypothetical protein WBH97_07485, partial [Rectinemataceae bacterium]
GSDPALYPGDRPSLLINRYEWPYSCGGQYDIVDTRNESMQIRGAPDISGKKDDAAGFGDIEDLAQLIDPALFPGKTDNEHLPDFVAQREPYVLHGDIIRSFSKLGNSNFHYFHFFYEIVFHISLTRAKLQLQGALHDKRRCPTPGNS